ncbi:MAG: septum formation protein Maf [Gammaproteobacteria bacterium]|nr:septum formation protein Maf [Gammaproteobacteria bacterium]
MHRRLWLASGSRYRRELLERLRLPFKWQAPELDESRLKQESPQALASRLALAKAYAIAQLHPSDLVIGSDQVCALGDRTLSKPKSLEAQAFQLAELSAQTVIFYTAVAIVCIEADVEKQHVDITRCIFRELQGVEITNYVAAESAIDCAGGFKCEGLGISLLERLHNEDPTALIGLPLIWVARTLRSI